MFITKKGGKASFGRVLKPTKQRTFKGKIYGFDIETSNKNKNFVCATIYENEQKYWTFTNKFELIKFLKTKRFGNSVIAATNLAFDFMGVFFDNSEMQKFNLLFRGSNMVYAKTYIKNKDFNNKSYKGNGRNTRKGGQGKKLVFIDTFNYCQMSVNNIGKLLGLPKLVTPSFIGKTPKNKAQWKELITYNVQDARISKEYISFLYDTFEKLGATPKLTIASTAMSLFKNKYLTQDYWRHPTEELIEQFKAYYGGRTEVFSRGKITDYNYYDFNSLYPSVMRYSYPDPNTKRITYKNTNHYINLYEGCSHVDVYCPKMKHPLLPYRTKEKLIFGHGNFTGWYSHVELRRASELGYVIKKVHKTYYFTGKCTPFKDYVEELYTQRMKYKDAKSPMQAVVKLLLNSLYGKFGQKFVDKDNWQPFNHTLEELDKLAMIERYGDFIRIKKPMSEPSNFCIPIWALYVTAYGRIKLHNAIMQTDPVYVDTDSLITKTEMPTSNALGDLKLEMTVPYGMIVKPKFYALTDKEDKDYVKIKGVGKRLSMMEFNNILINPKVIYDKFMKFKESVRRGFVPNEIQEMTKNLNLEDTKRVWEEQFNPLTIQHSFPTELINGMTEKEIEIFEEKQLLKSKNSKTSIVKQQSLNNKTVLQV